jgi:hypothetical protein
MATCRDHRGDPLTASYEQCLLNARALIAYCRRFGLPFGINVESLTNRKLEIDASSTSPGRSATCWAEQRRSSWRWATDRVLLAEGKGRSTAHR